MKGSPRPGDCCYCFIILTGFVMVLSHAHRLISSIRSRMHGPFQWLWTVGLVWLCMTSTTWAQAYEEEVEEKNYVPSSMIIMFAVRCALMAICRSGKRTVNFRREE